MTRTEYPAADRELLAQIITAPRFQRILDLPKFPWQEILLIVGVYGTLILATSGAIAGILPTWLAMVANATAIYAAFTPFHDASHSSASSDRSINDWIGTISAQPLFPGFTTGLYRFLHLEHHRHTGHPVDDPDDVLVAAPLPKRILSMMAIDLFWIPWYLRRWRERTGLELTRDAAGIGFFLVLHIGFLMSPYAWEFVIYWLIPQRVGMTFLTYMFAAIQHPKGVLQAEHPIQGTRMIKGGKLMHWALLAQSQHLMHHLFPSVPYYRYDRAWQASRDLLRQREIVWSWPVGKFDMPETTAAPAPRLETVRAKVVSIEDVSDEVRAFTLERADGEAFAAYEAGAHLDVHIDAHLAPNIIRQYSLSTAPRADGRYRIGVKREAEGRGGSRAMHELAVGDEIEIGLPRNHFPLDAEAEEVILAAGGIGITPLLAMAETLEAAGRSFTFHVCSRSLSVLPFANELEKAPYASRVALHLDDGEPGQRLSAEALPTWREGRVLYLCGPQGFMKAVAAMAEARGWPDEAVRTESFEAPEHDNSRNRPFEVELRKSGRILEVPADRSLLEVLQEAKVAEAVAVCTQGLCGSCALRVADGEIEHRDVVLSAEQRSAGFMTACVSRAAGDRIAMDL